MKEYDARIMIWVQPLNKYVLRKEVFVNGESGALINPDYVYCICQGFIVSKLTGNCTPRLCG